MTKGLPGCGKTTWAKQYQKDNPNTLRVNKDELRAMLHDSVHSTGRENFVLTVRDFIVQQGLKIGNDVIVDDTNFNPFHEVALKVFAEVNKAGFEVKDFTDVPLQECLDRDYKREGKSRVGAKIIKQMYNQYLKPKPQVIELDRSLPMAIICDIDGTLAHMKDRGPFDWKKVGSDDPDLTIWEILLRYRNVAEQKQMSILLVSGRDEVCRPETIEWLSTFNIPYDELWMRPKDDMRKDVLIKEEIYNNHIKGKYNIEFVLDDRDQVVDFWRSQGLTCLQVAEGDF